MQKPRRHSFLLLIKVYEGRKKILVPIPLFLLEEVVGAICWLAFWAFKFKPNLMITIQNKVKGDQEKIFKWIKPSGKTVMELLTMVQNFLILLRAEGPFTFVEVENEDEIVKIATY